MEPYSTIAHKVLVGIFFFRDMFCAGRVVEEDLKRTMKACGGAIQTSVNNMTDDVLGRCELFEEQQIGGDRYVHNNIGHLALYRLF